jgi:hypothetical protein
MQLKVTCIIGFAPCAPGFKIKTYEQYLFRPELVTVKISKNILIIL